MTLCRISWLVPRQRGLPGVPATGLVFGGEIAHKHTGSEAQPWDCSL